jgi:hypothetical protein
VPLVALLIVLDLRELVRRAVHVRLTPEESAHIEAAVSLQGVTGSRYSDSQMRILDGEP